jgi:hypothetical protein
LEPKQVLFELALLIREQVDIVEVADDVVRLEPSAVLDEAKVSVADDLGRVGALGKAPDANSRVDLPEKAAKLLARDLA